MDHFFDIDIASKYGVDCAIIIHNLCFWIYKNQCNKNNFYDGHYWTYNSERAFAEIFPYWSRRQIQTIINKLKKNSIIEVGNYNNKKYDRTNWYTVIDVEIMKKYKINHDITQKNSPLNSSVQSIEQNGAMSEIDSYNDENIKKEHSNKELITIEQNGAMHSTEWCNGLHENVQPIPYINTDNKTYIKNIYVDEEIQDWFESVWSKYPKKEGKNRITRSKTKLKALYKDRDNVEIAVDNYVKKVKDTDKQYIKNGSTFFNGDYKDYINHEDKIKIREQLPPPKIRYY